MQVVAHTFTPGDLVAGHRALDFVNTVTARDTTPRDWLDSYGRLLDWSAVGGVASRSELGRLRTLAAVSPANAQAALERARRFREALHQVASALIEGQPTPPEALTTVETVWRQAMARTRLSPAKGRLDAGIDPVRSGLDLVRDLLASSAIDLLETLPAGRARTCRGEHCGWLFVDTSKGGRRVWCDMATCGNTAKSRRHYAKHH